MSDGDDRLGDFDEPFAEDSQQSSTETDDVTAPTVEAPRAERPTAEVPEATVPSTNVERLETRYSNVDPEFKALFWRLVALYKFGFVGLTLGVLVVGFDAHPTAGPPLALGGGAFLVYALYLTYHVKTRLDADEYDVTTTDGEDGDESVGGDDGDESVGGGSIDSSDGGSDGRSSSEMEGESR